MCNVLLSRSSGVNAQTSDRRRPKAAETDGKLVLRALECIQSGLDVVSSRYVLHGADPLWELGSRQTDAIWPPRTAEI